LIAVSVDLDQGAARANASTSVRLSVQWGCPTVIADGVLDFYVAALDHFASSRRTWLVCREGVSNCVSIQDDLAAATAQAIRMAEYHADAGQAVQVHVQQEQGLAPWRTIWCSPDSAARFP